MLGMGDNPQKSAFWDFLVELKASELPAGHHCSTSNSLPMLNSYPLISTKELRVVCKGNWNFRVTHRTDVRFAKFTTTQSKGRNKQRAVWSRWLPRLAGYLIHCQSSPARPDRSNYSCLKKLQLSLNKEVISIATNTGAPTLLLLLLRPEPEHMPLSARTRPR